MRLDPISYKKGFVTITLEYISGTNQTPMLLVKNLNIRNVIALTITVVFYNKCHSEQQGSASVSFNIAGGKVFQFSREPFLIKHQRTEINT